MRSAVWLVLLLCLFLDVQLVAQKVTGTILGSVTDASGAAVAGASVTARNAATGDVRATTTSSSGTYALPDESAGTYEVAIKAANFKEHVTKRVEVNVSSNSIVVRTAGPQTPNLDHARQPAIRRTAPLWIKCVIAEGGRYVCRGICSLPKPARPRTYADAFGCRHGSPHIGVPGLAMARRELR